MSQPTTRQEHQPFVSDVEELRRRARKHMEEGAVTSAYSADRETVLRILNEVLATTPDIAAKYQKIIQP